MSAKRVKKRQINVIPLIIIIVFLAVISSVLYFVLVKPSNITCGIFLEKRDNGSTYNVKLGYADQVKWIKVSKRLGLPDALAYNVKLKGIVVNSITPCKSFNSKVLSYDYENRSIDLEIGKRKLSNDVRYYQVIDKDIKIMEPKSLIVGTENCNFIENDGVITAIIIHKPDLKNIRVGLSTSRLKSKQHSSVLFFTNNLPSDVSKLTIKYDDKIITASDFMVGIKMNQGYMEITSYGQNPKTKSIYQKTLLAKTKSRIYVFSDYEQPRAISFESFDKGDVNWDPKTFPQYFGTFEMSINDNNFSVINEVNIDKYANLAVYTRMKKMGDYPTAYCVQAIALRTYALSVLLSGNYAKYGYHIEDTDKNQPYNPGKTNSVNERGNINEIDTPIETALQKLPGLVMTYNDEIIDAKSYSTSCGVGTPYKDVWYESSLPDKDNPKPYLSFKDYSFMKINSLESEEAASNFLKDWTAKTYDSNSMYFRWKYSIDFSEVSKKINSTIYQSYLKSKGNFKKKWYFNIYMQADIPKKGIGKITDLSISKRGISGNILELTIESESGTYKITKDANIKPLLITKNTTVDFLYGNPVTGYITPPSSFFVIEKKYNATNTRIATINVYGGGYGHGVGLSQYGVVGMVREGKSYKEIIANYYTDITLENYKNVINRIYE